jgi:hypothetical protein
MISLGIISIKLTIFLNVIKRRLYYTLIASDAGWLPVDYILQFDLAMCLDISSITAITLRSTFPSVDILYLAHSFPAGEFECESKLSPFDILLSAPISWAHGSWWGPANKGASKSCTNGAGLLSALEHVYVKKSWRVTSTSLICCYSNIHFGWWCMYIVQQKSWLGWLNNIHIPVSTHNKVVEKIRFLSLDSFRCVQTRRSVIFHLKLSVVFQMSNETRSLCQSPHRRTCVKKLKKFIRAKKFQISRGEISNVENYLSHQM